MTQTHEELKFDYNYKHKFSCNIFWWVHVYVTGEVQQDNTQAQTYASPYRMTFWMKVYTVNREGCEEHCVSHRNRQTKYFTGDLVFGVHLIVSEYITLSHNGAWQNQIGSKYSNFHPLLHCSSNYILRLSAQECWSQNKQADNISYGEKKQNRSITKQ